ncbi:MAG: hypothetical protein KatS3mg095_0186 [Candidatus Parcubacteria bacterium]|nr:MAG: hypothetical protein KatS3mg095_0186 [Candidatus Parcubacteria bacterium]
MPLNWFKKNKKEEDKKKVVNEEKNDNSQIKTFSKFNLILNKNFEILPIISEKTKKLAKEENTYVFKVRPININRNEIKKSIEDIFNVNVLKIRIANYKKRIRGRTRIPSVRYRFKKIFVKLKEGQKINVFD